LLSRGEMQRRIISMGKREQTISLLGVIALAVILPAILRLSNSVVKFFVGAEGRLASISVETDHILGPLPHPWSAIAQGGEQLPSFLDGNNAGIVAAIKPDYIRIDHIYDQFDVVSRGGGGLQLDWTKLDTLVNKMLSTGAKPFFSLSYMPPALASGDVTSEPTNWGEWQWLVQKTIEHYSGQLGLPDVYYEVWNEPDLFGKWRMGGKKDYKMLYLYSARGAAAASGVRPFKFGGPATTGLYKNWIDNFLPYIVQNRLRLDFFSWHRYTLNAADYTTDVKDVDRWLESHPYFAGVEKIISETGPESKVSQINSSTAGAAQLIASARELLYKVKYGFNFAVTGQWGILGTPRYEALRLLNQLGSSRLAITGEGTWVTAIGAQKGDSYQVLVVNYDPKGQHSEVVPVNFLNLKDKEFTLTTTMLGGKTVTKEVATTEAVLQQYVSLSSNSVALIELAPKTIVRPSLP
jgi:hypothetical protein